MEQFERERAVLRDLEPPVEQRSELTAGPNLLQRKADRTTNLANGGSMWRGHRRRPSEGALEPLDVGGSSDGQHVDARFDACDTLNALAEQLLETRPLPGTTHDRDLDAHRMMVDLERAADRGAHLG